MFLFFCCIDPFKDFSHSIKIFPRIHALALWWYVIESAFILICRKHCGHALLPITNGSNLSVPVALHARRTVMRDLSRLCPEVFPLASVAFGDILKKRDI